VGLGIDIPASALVDEERAAWRPFEALERLSDEQLDEPVAAAHDWSGRDLIAHLVAWLDDAVEAAHELGATDASQARERSERAFADRGDEINAEIQATWRQLPMAEVRRRFREVPEELRRALIAVPAARWSSRDDDRRFFRVYSIEHYDDHVADLEAILAAAGPDRTAEV
jgi:hypothetical protein